MSRPGNLKVVTAAGHNSTSPSLQGLAIISENQTLKSPETIPDISIDESFLSNGQIPALKLKTEATELEPSQKNTTIPAYSLCGARIAVYGHSGTGRTQQKKIATIGGVFRIGDRHFALTAAHAFFDNVTSYGSWTDKGHFISYQSDNTSNKGDPPKIADLYEVVIDTYWPNAEDPDTHTRPTNISIGLVAPSVLQRRRGPEVADLPEVLWNHELDWALIELREAAFWQPNTLLVSSSLRLDYTPPAYEQKPPMGEVIVAAGVSGVVLGLGLDTTKDIWLPWSLSPIQTWTVASDLTIGDCGAMVVDPKSGVVYGIVISHDSEARTSYVIPAPVVFESILGRYSEETLTLNDLFSAGKPQRRPLKRADTQRAEKYLRTPVIRSADTNVRAVFLSTLKTFSLQSFDGRQFIRRVAWADWLASLRRDGITHLDFMLDDAYPRNAMLPATSDQISSVDAPCVLVFSLLFELGRGELIHLFMRQGLTDNKFPFERSILNEAVDRMDLPETDSIVQDFYDNQWPYCPMIFDHEMERDVPAQVVVPIHQRQQINSKGGSATLWQVTVLEEFIGKRLQAISTRSRFNDTTDKLGYRYHFAIKSFAKHQSVFFENEITSCKAFRTIPSMIGYLGNYHQTVERPKRRAPSFSITEERKPDHSPSETNNIVLEYGDYDLDEYFAATQPPVLPIQVTQFWEDIAGIAEAISEVHNFSTRRAGVTQEYSGWHAAIKPDNILSVKGTFKLSDPGSARVETSEKKMTRLAGGTKTFGSPEAFSTQHVQNYPVSQAIDIWSLGCVLSVAATWVILGWKGVTQFQQLRIEALKRRASPTHDRNRSRSRSGGRKPQLGIETVKKSPYPEGDCFHDGKKVLEEVQHWHKFLRSVTRQSDEVSIKMLDLVDDKMLVTNPQERIEAAELYREMRLIVHNGEVSSKQSTPDIVSKILLETTNNNTTDGPRHSATTLSSIRTDVPSVSPNLKASSRSLHPPSPQPPQPTSFGSRLTVVTSSTAASEGDEQSQAVQEVKARPPFQNLVLNEMGGRSVSSSIDIPVHRSKPANFRSGALAPARRMSVSQAKIEVDKRKKVFSRRRKDPFLVKHLENRDIEFLIDNGDTMTKYWSEVKDLIEILCTMVSDVDKDGYDLSFTNGPVKLKQKSNSKAIRSTMDNDRAKPVSDVRTDMAEAMHRIFRQHFARLRARAQKSSSNKNYTLIVLTDGVWRGMEQSHAVEDMIVRFMNELSRFEGLKRKSRSVTIQFIQFGNDEKATSRLQMLDRGLCDYEIPDVIDMEPSNGNVWKMLLGSVEASFDYADSGA